VNGSSYRGVQTLDTHSKANVTVIPEKISFAKLCYKAFNLAVIVGKLGSASALS